MHGTGDCFRNVQDIFMVFKYTYLQKNCVFIKSNCFVLAISIKHWELNTLPFYWFYIDEEVSKKIPTLLHTDYGARISFRNIWNLVFWITTNQKNSLRHRTIWHGHSKFAGARATRKAYRDARLRSLLRFVNSTFILKFF